MTLDQLLALDAIVATGTFRGAAERLNKAQSAVSHQIRKLEDRLRFDLFSRDEYRPRLTTEGEVFFREASRVLEQVRVLESTALGLRSAQEPVLRIAITATMSLDPILNLLGRIGRAYPSTQIRVAAEMMGGPLARLMEGEADMMIAGLHDVPVDQVDTVPVGSVTIRPVAHRDFPAAQLSGIRSRREMQAYIQVIVPGTGGRDFEQSRDLLSGGQRWTVSDFETKKSVIKAGLGWGGMPEHLMVSELASGELVPLNVEDFPPRHTEIFAVRRRDQTMGRVMSEIWAALQDQSTAISCP
ncbi:MAG: LysR family transcriptional regulator [Pseudomonadota bacterium]